MANFWDILADKTSDASIGDTSEQIKQAEDDAKKGIGTKTNEQWGNESVGGSNVADSSDHGNTSGYTYSG
ncbi:MAG: hypothetical protein H7196_03850 [candidate division SR1 bacterium]|nr:hypothetical protein [candidate division SR1 bacterium]